MACALNRMTTLQSTATPSLLIVPPSVMPNPATESSTSKFSLATFMLTGITAALLQVLAAAAMVGKLLFKKFRGVMPVNSHKIKQYTTIR